MKRRNLIPIYLVVSFVFYWVVIPVTLLCISLFLNDKMNIFWHFSPWRIFSGVLLVIISLYLAVWATSALWYTGRGLPISSFPPKRLVASGPYSYTRHPLYLAFILYTFGIGLIFSPSMVFIVNPIFILLLILHILKEERLLLKKFGEDYLYYRKNVPGLWKFKKRTEAPYVPNPFIISLYLILSCIFKKIFNLQPAPKFNRDMGPYIIASNHQCYLDPLFLVAALGLPIRFLTTGKMFNKRISKRFFLSLGTIPVYRCKSKAPHILLTKKALKSGDIVGIFPEASRSWDGNFVGIDRRVLRLIRILDYPILVVRIDGSYNVLPRWSKVYHRANVSVKIMGWIEEPRKLTERELKEKIINGISNAKRSKARWGRMNKYIETLIWRCPECSSEKSIVRKGTKSFYCKYCGKEWNIDDEMIVVSKEYRKLKDSFFRNGVNLPVKINEEVTLEEGYVKVGGEMISIEDIKSISIDGTDEMLIALKNDNCKKIKTPDALRLKMYIELLKGVEADDNTDFDPFWF